MGADLTQLGLTPPEGPGRAGSGATLLRPQGQQQRQLQAQAGDHTVTRAQSRLHLTFGGPLFFPVLTLYRAPFWPSLLLPPQLLALRIPFLNCQRQDPKWAQGAKLKIWTQQVQVPVPPRPG